MCGCTKSFNSAPAFVKFVSSSSFGTDDCVDDFGTIVSPNPLKANTASRANFYVWKLSEPLNFAISRDLSILNN